MTTNFKDDLNCSRVHRESPILIKKDPKVDIKIEEFKEAKEPENSPRCSTNKSIDSKEDFTVRSAKQPLNKNASILNLDSV